MIGSTVLGHYEIVDVLGQGGMSVVYKARHALTDQEAALKILPRELAANVQVKSRFVEEAKALAALDHPHIVHLYNFGEDNGCFILAMQFIAGDTFERMIFDAEELPWYVAAHVAIDVLRALEYAHGRGIIHRDMKPSNILVREDDGSATVMDFGIAKMTNSTRLTATGQTMGTVRYMSPEQVRGKEVDPRTDIYSLGASLYEAVCGDTPFDGDTHFAIMNQHLNTPPIPPREEGIDLPPAFEEMLLTALAKKPDQRFDSARAMRKEIEHALQDAGMGRNDTLRETRDALARTGARRAARGRRSRAEVATPDDSAAPGRSRAVTVPNSGKVKRATQAQGSAPGRRRGPVDGQEDRSSRDMRDMRDMNDMGDAGDVAAGNSPSAGLGDRAGDEVVSLGLIPNDTGRSRSKPVLWLVLASVVLVASGVAVFALDRSDTGPEIPPEPPEVAPSPDDFLPPGVKLEVDQRIEEHALRVRAPAGWDVARTVEAYRQAHSHFIDLARKRDPSSEIPEMPLVIAVVPRWVLCDERVYETGKVPGECAGVGAIYRLRGHTVVVADEDPEFEDNLLYGVAQARCFQARLPGCESIVAQVDDEVHRRRRDRQNSTRSDEKPGVKGDSRSNRKRSRSKSRSRRRSK